MLSALTTWLRTPSTGALLASGAVALLLVAASPALAQNICADPGNVTLNCDFASGITGWAQEHGTSFGLSPDGHDAPGSIEIVAQSTMGYSAEISQCIGGLSGIAGLDYGAWFHIVSGTVLDCSISIGQYSDDNCTTFAGWDGYYEHDLLAGWSWVGGRTKLPTGARGVRIYAECYSLSSTFIVHIDDIYLGDGISHFIFRDGFEIGNVSLWDASVP